VRDQFLVEVDPTRIDGLVELNRLFSAWVESVYHRHVHSETGQRPLDRFAPPQLRYPTAAELHEAFLWSEHRTVTKTATVSLFGNDYEVGAALAGRRVELVFDPFDLTTLEVRFDGRPMGAAVAHHVHRHSHPAARPDPVTEPVLPTGIDYLRLVETRHADQQGDRIQFGQLRLPNELLPQPLPPSDPEPDAATGELNR